MPFSAALIRKITEVEPPLREILISILEEMEKQREKWEASVTKSEFNELKEIVRDLGKSVRELAEAQRRSEERLTRLETVVEELAEAQRRSEERLTRLETVVEELAEAQRRSEERLDRLEKIVGELAEAQRRTEEEIAKLVRRMEVFEERLEGLSNSVGYSLENRTYRTLPDLLAKRYGLRVEGRLIRRYFPVGRKEIQVNIFGRARRNGQELLVLGECKVRPSKREIERFEKYARKIAEAEGKEAFLVFVAHDFPPKIETLLREKGLAYFWSYELE